MLPLGPHSMSSIHPPVIFLYCIPIVFIEPSLSLSFIIVHYASSPDNCYYSYVPFLLLLPSYYHTSLLVSFLFVFFVVLFFLFVLLFVCFFFIYSFFLFFSLLICCSLLIASLSSFSPFSHRLPLLFFVSCLLAPPLLFVSRCFRL